VEKLYRKKKMEEKCNVKNFENLSQREKNGHIWRKTHQASCECKCENNIINTHAITLLVRNAPLYDTVIFSHCILVAHYSIAMHLLLHIVIYRCNVISPVLRPVVQKKRHDSESDVELELFRY
jgi:hypothetical protein